MLCKLNLSQSPAVENRTWAEKNHLYIIEKENRSQGHVNVGRWWLLLQYYWYKVPKLHILTYHLVDVR